MPIQLNGSAGISTPAITSGEYNSGQLAGFRNKILNGRFNINQAGAESRTAVANAYNFDQWYYDGTYLYQPVPTEDVYDGTYTLSWEGASNAAWSLNAGTAAAQGSQTYTPVAKGGQIVVSGKTNQHLWVRFATDLGNLNKVQLEPGTGATPFEDRLYSQELFLCQKFFFSTYRSAPVGSLTALGSINASALTSGTGGGGIFFHFSFPVEMRGTPYSIGVYSPATGAAGAWSPFAGGADVSSLIFDASSRGVTVSNSTAVVAATAYRCHLVANARI